MNLLVTGAWAGAKENIEKLEALEHKVVFMQQEKDDLPCDYEWVEGVVCNGLFLTHPIEKFQSLRFIQLTSAGFDRVPMDYIKEHGIEIHNAKGVYSIPMAEFAIAGVLELYKQSRFFWDNQKEHKWEKHRGLIELSGKIVVIVGCGDVGTECARRFSAFGCRVLGMNRTIRENKYFDKIYSLNELDEVIGIADVVVLTVALSDETRGLINEYRMRLLKPTAALINIARGGVLDYIALEKMVDSIGGAVLDVFEEEPLNTSSPLWNKSDVIITPHNSFVGDGNKDRLNKLIMENVQR
ncbi:MAG: hydroxyacid dehydrogenase [Eubacterium sp.]|nr:hydroxyacid dehydrogenase [Eubacterium sp.]